MNDLSEGTRNKLKIGLLLFLLAYAVVYTAVMYFKYTPAKTTKTKNGSGQIIFTQPTLIFFTYKLSLNLYPDRITIHYPYLVVVRPDAWKSEIYNMQSRKKEKIFNEVILDYYNGNMAYNKQGYKTYYNKKDLGLLCDRAFIKSLTEILCITRPDSNKQDDKLISINPQTLEQKDVYTSQNVLTAIYFDKETLYIGEYNFIANKAFITVNNKTAPIDDLVNIIYPMQDKFYSASFKSLRNKQTESYYEIQKSNNNLATKFIEKGKIIFFE